MTDIRYHPLVDADTDGREKTPMFFTTDRETVDARHALYLEEFVPHRYRLHARAPHSMAAYLGYNIHCPYCGAVMEATAPHIDQYTLAVYACKKCKEN